jgi:hypothetical protein
MGPSRGGILKLLRSALRHRAPVRIMRNDGGDAGISGRIRRVHAFPLPTVALVFDASTADRRLEHGRVLLHFTAEGEMRACACWVLWRRRGSVLCAFPRDAKHAPAQGDERRVDRDVRLTCELAWEAELPHETHARGLCEITTVSTKGIEGVLRGVERGQRFPLGTLFRDARLRLQDRHGLREARADLELRSLIAREESHAAFAEGTRTLTALTLGLSFAEGAASEEAAQLLRAALTGGDKAYP